MSEFQFVRDKKAIIIVAHPDDETIWMGGTILKNPQLDWMIYSLCRFSDKDREPKFRKVCAHYGAKALISDLDDTGTLDLESASEEAEKLIEKNISGKKVDYLFTHGKNGEYGHEGHLAVHQAINNLIAKRKLKPEAVFYFNYNKNKKNAKPLIISAPKSDITLHLEERYFLEKKRIVAEMYGYPYDGIDVGYCTNPESFSQLKIKN